MASRPVVLKTIIFSKTNHLRQQVIRSLRDLLIQKEVMKQNKLTPKQQSELSRQKLILREQTHMHCPMQVRVRGPHTGLYCYQHGTWIRWISSNQANTIKDML